MGIRFYELVALSTYHHLPTNMFELFLSGNFSDIVYLFNVFLLLSILYFFLSLKNLRLAFSLHLFLIILITMVQLGLTKYFSQTFIPLGADLFGYTLSDIQKTVQSSSSSSGVAGLVGVILLIVLIILTPRFMRDYSLSKLYINIFIFLCLFSVPINILTHPHISDYEHETQFYLATNKSDYFIAKSLKHFFDKTSSYDNATVFSFPLMKNANYQDTLGPLFNLSESKPNLVFLIVEGLGGSLMDDGVYGGFTPYLDELSKKSLYWKNFLSLSGRTFGVLPSLLASLPYGEKGFMEYEEAMPDHMSLISLLKKNGYYTRFLHGGDINFDRRRSFLLRQGIDVLMGQDFFGPEFEKAATDEGGFSWGYPDHALFKRAMQVIDENKKEPYLNIYLTLTSHEPFIPPFNERYLNLYEKKLATLKNRPGALEVIKKYKKEFSTFLYVDESIRNFMEEYKKRPEYGNTIFFITGDHRMIPVPHSNKIARFHVPFILFSPMLKEAITFSSVSSHLDVTPSLLALLNNRYNMTLPKVVHWLGEGIDMSKEFRAIKNIPFMRTKNELNDYLYGKYFLAGDELFELTPSMDLEPLNDSSLQSKILKKLNDFKIINKYVCENNHIMPNGKNEILSKKVRDEGEDDSSIKYNVDEMFDLAKKRAYEGNRSEAIAICQKVLKKYPKHNDFRALMGRVYAWDKKYGESKNIFKELIMLAPNYPDGYAGLSQVEFWTGHHQLALEQINKALEFNPDNTEHLMIKARIVYSLKDNDEALRIVNEVLDNNPRMKDALDFKKRFNNIEQ